MLWQLKTQWKQEAITKMPVNMTALIYREKNVGDALNYLEAIADALERAGVVKNDRLIVSFDGSRLLKDADRPRVEVVLTTLETLASATRCYCGTDLRDGACRYQCPPSANPEHLRAQAGKRRERERLAKVKCTMLSVKDMQGAVKVPEDIASRVLFTRGGRKHRPPSALKQGCREGSGEAGEDREAERDKA